MSVLFSVILITSSNGTNTFHLRNANKFPRTKNINLSHHMHISVKVNILLTDTMTLIVYCRYPISVHTISVHAFSYRFIFYCALFVRALYCIFKLFGFMTRLKLRLATGTYTYYCYYNNITTNAAAATTTTTSTTTKVA